MHEFIDSGQDATDVLAGVMRALRELDPAAEDAVKVDQIRALEELKAAVAAAQARVTSAFVASQRDANRAAGVKAERAEQGITAQVALARRCSPFRARQQVGWARVLTSELPGTFAQLQAGATTEWRAFLMARETVWLSREDRAAVDAELAPRLEQLGDRQVEREVKAAAYRLDPDGFTDRLRNVTADRRVSLRPAPDTMVRLSALLPVREGVRAYAALGRDADTIHGTGAEGRSRGQVMADLLVERLTGRSVAEGGPIEVNLVMGTDSLLGDEPAHLQGYGPVPAPLARSWISDPENTAPVWLRRLFAHPRTGQLIGMESRRRAFTKGQAKFLRLRDQTCRTPYCGAPVRHADHIRPVEAGGPTSIGNGQGLCAACNYAKTAPGWRARPEPDGTVTTTTPTGHSYISTAPDPPRHAWRAPTDLEWHTAEIIYLHTHPPAA